MLTFRKILALFILFVILYACGPVESGNFAGKPSGPAAASYSGMIIVANTTTRTVVLYDSSFNFVKILRQYSATAAEAPASVAFYDSENIMVAVEGADRVEKINLTTGEINAGFILDANLTGAMKGLARLSGGDVLISDAATGAHMERFAIGTVPVRATVGWPATLLNTTQMIFPLSNNTFLACAAGTSQVARTYSNAGAQTGTASATVPTPTLGSAHNAKGCVADSTGRIAVAWSGTADAVRLYNSTLTTTVWTYSDAVKLNTPVALAVRPNGNFLAADNSNVVSEIKGSDGSFVTSFTSPYFATIAGMLVMP